MVAVLNPAGQGSQIVIDRAVVLVGRGSDCDAIIDFSSKISRMHCLLVQVDAEHYIRDLGSLNGVWLNGERVQKEAQLTQGDSVAIGDVEFQFHANIQPAPRVAVRSGGGATGMPVLIDDQVEVLDAEIFSDAVLDAQLVEDIELADDVEFVGDVEFVEDVDVIEAIEVLDVIDDIEVLDDIEVIDDIEVLDDEKRVSSSTRRPRRPPRLR